MADAADRVTRVAADLFEAAAVEGARQRRSAKQQLDHWARIGRAVSTQHTASRRRVEAALAGEIDVDALNIEEGVVFNAETAAAVEEKLAHTNYGAVLASRGITTVTLGDDGRIIELAAGRASRVWQEADRIDELLQMARSEPLCEPAVEPDRADELIKGVRRGRRGR